MAKTTTTTTKKLFNLKRDVVGECFEYLLIVSCKEGCEGGDG